MQKREFVTILEAGDGSQRYSLYVQRTGISGEPGNEERQSLSDLTPTQVHVQSRLSLREKKAKVMQTSER